MIQFSCTSDLTGADNQLIVQTKKEVRSASTHFLDGLRLPYIKMREYDLTLTVIMMVQSTTAQRYNMVKGERLLLIPLI